MMKDVLLRDAEKYALAHKRKRRWQRVVTALSGVVVFCTTYALILPAITMEKKCEIPEHTHTEACYTQVTSREKRVLACKVEADVVVHQHDSACWDENGSLVCTLPEIELHRHTDSCYTIPEVHTHGEACYTSKRGDLICTQSTEPQHTHTEDCYQEARDLVCGMSESTGHTHGEECYDGEGNLTCGQEESQGHVHGEACYEVSQQLTCGQTEEPAHQHTDECYSLNQVLTCEKSTEAAQPVRTCEKDEIELHTHQPFISQEDPGCYDAEGKNLVCGKLQVVEHQHTEACFETVEEPVDTEALTCTLPEDETHTHTALCYGTWELTCGMEEHTHSEACTATEPEKAVFCGKEPHTHGDTCRDEQGELTCTLEEHTHSEACTATEPEKAVFCGKEPHTHGESCRDEQGELICGMEEHTHSEACTATEPEKAVFCGKEPHTHGESCRDEQGELTCTLEEHTHSLACYADPTADVETAEIWEQTFGDVSLTGDWRLDALAIAQSQLGYAESTKNYAVAEDGQTLMGYTRYGAWQGTPYDEWNAPFLAFCLHYAEVEDVPPAGDWGGWATAWPEAFRTPKDYTPAAGDLVLFDRDGDGTADRLAIVAEVTDQGFTAIEGNAEHAVGQRAYETADSGILGYVVLPQGPKEFTLTAQSETGITVTVTGPRESLPCAAREITLAVTENVDEESRAVRDALLGEEQAEPGRSFLLDITLRQGEEEIEPKGPVTVTFSGLNTQGLYPKVYHIDPDNQTVKDMEAEKTETGDVTVDTDHFSLYLLSAVAPGELKGYIGNMLENGGNFQLSGPAWTANDGNTANLAITADTTIDLNGYTLTISKANQFFEVQNGATLTIMDSATVTDDVTNPKGVVYGNTASLTGDTLTYYITKSTPKAAGTGTTETLELHTVTLTNAGKILSGEPSEQLIKVQNGGTLELQSGVLQGTGIKHIVYVDGGTLNVSGGYIVGGGRDDSPGGGIYVDSGAERGKVEIQGGVVAANRGNFGGGIYVVGGELTISGGAVTGNEVFNGHDDDGGGIYVNSGTLKLSGNGYVTNNSKSCECDTCKGDTSNTHGGGGIALANGSTMEMSGGYVTGNFSSLAGGGIYAGYYAGEGGVHFTMSGGTIASNCAKYGEGGGLRIGGGDNGGTKGVIRAEGTVYITNNKTLTTDDWGGGGIFVQQGGNLSVINALITNNKAGGFGGGVGACPTGETLIVNESGAAIYDNNATGEQMSAGGGGKHYDTDAKNDPDFFNNGYKDYFCVRSKDGANQPISLVTGQMAGGGAANWTGSCDDHTVSIGKTGYAAANYRFGLEAKPDATAISSAVNTANVIITGNSSGVHGGGIMTNGGLILGDPGSTKVVTARPELDITGTKELVKDGVKQNEGLNFKFQLRDQAGKVIETESDSDTGIFTFSPNVQGFEAGTYTYTLSEVNDGTRPDINYDTNLHEIKVTIEEKTVTLLKVDFKSFYVKSVTVDGKVVGDSSGSGSGGNTGTGSETAGTFKVHFKNKSDKSWDPVYMYVWDGNNKPAGEWPGKEMNLDTDGSWYYDLSVNETGNYNYIFNDGETNNPQQDVNKTKEIMSVHYEPGKEVWFDYDTVRRPNTDATGSTGAGGVSRGANADGSYTLVLDTPTFQNTMTTRLDLQIVKTDSVSGDVLQGAIFTLTKAAPGGNLEEKTTGENGIATFTGIHRGATYYLRETQAPPNYMTAGPWILVVEEDGNATLYPATEKAGGTLEKTNETDRGTPLKLDSTTNPKVLKLTVKDTPWGYELPETGGAGTTSYTAGGLVLMFSGAVLLYIHSKGRKEEKASS